MKIKTYEELKRILIDNFNAEISSLEEVNSFDCYSVVNDNEHDYSLLKGVFKIDYSQNKVNPYNVIFLLIFSKNGGVLEIKGLGETPKQLDKIWKDVIWED